MHYGTLSRCRTVPNVSRLISRRRSSIAKALFANFCFAYRLNVFLWSVALLRLHHDASRERQSRLQPQRFGALNDCGISPSFSAARPVYAQENGPSFWHRCSMPTSRAVKASILSGWRVTLDREVSEQCCRKARSSLRKKF